MGIFITAGSAVQKNPKKLLTQLAAGFPGGRGSPGERSKPVPSGDGADPGGFPLELVITCANHPLPLRPGAQKPPWSCSPLVQPDSSHQTALGGFSAFCDLGFGFFFTCLA